MADMDAYQRLRAIYGIRNRFWARPADRLRPLLEDARRRAAIRNHTVIVLALVEALRRAGTDSRSTERAFYRRIARAWNRFRRMGELVLSSGQQVVAIEKDGMTSLIIRNRDGSPDDSLRRVVLSELDRMIEEVARESAALRGASEKGVSSEDLRARAAEILLGHLPFAWESIDSLSLTGTAEDRAWQDLLGSAPGRVLSAMIPGFPLMARLIQERKRIRENPAAALRSILTIGLKDSLSGIVPLLLSGLRAGEALSGPLALVLKKGIDRVESLGRSVRLLERQAAGLSALRAEYKTVELATREKEKTL